MPVLRYDRQRTEQTLKEDFYDRQTRITCSGRTRISARSGPRGSALVISSGAAHRGLYFISGERDPEAFWRGRECALSWRCGTCYSRDRDNGGRIRRDLIHLRQDLPVAPVSGICDPVLSAFCGKIPEG